MPIYPPYDNEISEEEYLIREPEAEYKNEYRDGRMVAMSGASPAHERITGNVFGDLRQILKGGPCEVFTSNLRIKVAAARFYTYPDVSVVCGPAQFDAKDPHSLINPTVIVEVLSPSSETYDRGQKFSCYQKLDSLSDYILIRQDRVHIEHFMRKNNKWESAVYQSLDDVLYFLALDCRLSLRAIYERVIG